MALERVVARGADVTLGASSDLVERAVELGARDARLGPVAAPPLPPAVRDREQVRAELLRTAGVGDPATPVLLAVGRLAEQKDYPTLLSALGPAWPAGVARPLLVVAGDGPMHDALQARIREHGLPALLLGRRADVPDLLAAADVYVLSSHWEAGPWWFRRPRGPACRSSRPRWAGCPTWCTASPSWCRAATRRPLAAALAGLLADPDRRRALGRGGRRTALTWPDEAATTRQVRAVYAGLVAGPG